MPALISTVQLDERRRPGGINVRRPLAGKPPADSPVQKGGESLLEPVSKSISLPPCFVMLPAEPENMPGKKYPEPPIAGKQERQAVSPSLSLAR